MYTEDQSRNEYGADYDMALTEWGKFKSEPAAFRKAVEIIKKVEALMGKVELAYKVSSDQYVAIKYSEDPRSFVFVNKGFVDHRVELADSYLKPEEEVWRTNLPTSAGQKAGSKKPQEIARETCTTCFIQYAKHLSACPICNPQD